MKNIDDVVEDGMADYFNLAQRACINKYPVLKKLRPINIELFCTGYLPQDSSSEDKVIHDIHIIYAGKTNLKKFQIVAASIDESTKEVLSCKLVEESDQGFDMSYENLLERLNKLAKQYHSEFQGFGKVEIRNLGQYLWIRGFYNVDSCEYEAEMRSNGIEKVQKPAVYIPA